MDNAKMQTLMKKARNLPLQPGVYIMHDASGAVIYVGKAKVLKNRVSQYFGTQHNHSDKVRRMVENVDDFEYIICTTEYEALMLECSLIKQYMPKYNILLKDDKGFQYIRVTKPPFSSIKAVKQKLDDGAEYIGPFYNGYDVRLSVEAAVKAFKLPQCDKTAKDMGRAKRPCLNYHIGLCAAPCCGKVTAQEHQQAVDGALKFISDGSKEAIAELTKQMNDASENMEFEKAARLRDSIKAIKKLNEHQRVTDISVKEQDVFALASGSEKSCVELFSYRDGRLTARDQFMFDRVQDVPSFMGEFIVSFYSFGRYVPARITLGDDIEDIELITRFLSEKRGKKCVITVPERGEQKRIVDMCRSNAAEYLSEKTRKRGHTAQALDELTRLLGLEKVPEYIEAYDISHTAGDSTVGAMVVYRDGLPYRAGYRKFEIQGIQNDDCSSMAQVLHRRFDEYIKHNELDDGDYFGVMPDVILLDGGIGQIDAVAAELDRMGISVPLFGMVKDDKHRTRAVTSGGGEIAIKATRSVYTLVYGIQEEVHRFAIGYHRQKRKKKMLGSSLTAIEGIGPTRVKNLMLNFGTVDAIRKAQLSQLEAVKGMTKVSARKLYEYFHGKEDE